MPTDIYGRSQVFGGAFSVDETSLTFSGSAGSAGTLGSSGTLGALVQNVQGQYQRPVQRIYELSSEKRTYFVAGRAEGGLNIGRIAAPGPITTDFLKQFGDICNVRSNHMAINAGGVGCANNSIGSNASKYDIHFCFISGISFQIAADQIAMSENLQMTFMSFNITNRNNDVAVRAEVGSTLT